jgi:hypothetical protein
LSLVLVLVGGVLASAFMLSGFIVADFCDEILRSRPVEIDSAESQAVRRDDVSFGEAVETSRGDAELLHP